MSVYYLIHDRIYLMAGADVTLGRLTATKEETMHVA